MLRAPPPSVVVSCHDGVGLVAAKREFMEKLYSQTRVDQRGNDFAETVLPLKDRALDQLRRTSVARLVSLKEQFLVKVSMRRCHMARIRSIEDTHERMSVDYIERAARLEMILDNSSPPFEVRQPAKDSVRREHDIKLAIKYIRQVVNIGAAKIGVRPDLVFQQSGKLDRSVREVDSGRLGAQARPRHSVQTEMTLEMEERFTGNVTDFPALDLRKGILPDLPPTS